LFGDEITDIICNSAYDKFKYIKARNLVMNQSKQMRMENPIRLAELDPIGTLQRIGIGETDVICDVGAGSGIFTIPAARLTGGKVYGLEIDDEMLEVIEEKAKDQGLSNIDLVKVENDRFPLDNGIADLLFMVTVLHEIENKAAFLSETKRVLKENGKIMVIEFHKRETPFGPPVPHRLGREETQNIMEEAGLFLSDELILGDNFYCLIFKRRMKQ
jgi:2-polyprenyl-3-methyl-5-hydroxy-6-metoxy-1,4-benzoquinol methylase